MFSTDSGVLTAGLFSVTNDSIGWNTIVLTTTNSGISEVSYKVHPTTHTVVFNSTSATGVFTYCLINPGLGSSK